MKKAKKKLVDLSEDTELVGMYDKEIVDRKVNNTKLLYAEKVGMERGMKKGIKEGKEQREKAIIENMLKENIDIKIISKVVGIAEDEILKYKEL